MKEKPTNSVTQNYISPQTGKKEINRQLRNTVFLSVNSSKTGSFRRFKS